MTLKPGAWIDPALFIKQIADAGYEARKDEVRLTLTGKLDKEGDRLLLTLDDVKPEPQKFVIVKGESKKEKETKDFADAYTQAEAFAGKTVQVEGLWKPANTKQDKNALPTLTLTHIGEWKPKNEP